MRKACQAGVGTVRAGPWGSLESHQDSVRCGRDLDTGTVAAATVFGPDAYPTLHSKAAALLHSLANNHALADGNKRLAWAATAVFMWINGNDLDAPEDDAFDLVIAVADGSLTDVEKSAERLAGWSRPR